MTTAARPARDPLAADLTRFAGMGGTVANVSWALSGILVVAVGWEVYYRLNPSLFVPTVSNIVRSFFSHWLDPDIISTHLGGSVRRLVVGWGLSLVIGLVIGFFLGISTKVRAMFQPTADFMMSTPAIAFAPVAVMILGINENVNYFIIVTGSIWPLVINTADGIGGTDEMYLRSARALKLGTLRTWLLVRIPAASPQIFAGARVSLAIAIILLIASEMYISPTGIGSEMVRAQYTFQVTEVWSGLLLLGLIGVGLSMVWGLAEQRLLRWHSRT